MQRNDRKENTSEDTIEELETLWLSVHNFNLVDARNKQLSRLGKFKCGLCVVYCRNFQDCNAHINDVGHIRKVELASLNSTLQNMPDPAPGQLQFLDNLLTKVHEEYALTDDMLLERTAIANKIINEVESKITDVKITLYGSLLAGFGISTSNINLDFKANVPEERAKFKETIKVLEDSGLVKDITPVTFNSLPTFKFTTVDKEYKIELGVNNHETYKTSELLRRYYVLDSRVRILTTCLIVWAKKFHIDSDYGYLPTFAYNLLLVYFLQQIKPHVLPILSDKVDEDPLKSENNMSVGELWISFFKFYSVTFPVGERVVCIRTPEPIKRYKDINTYLLIKDPCYSEKASSEYILNAKNFDIIENCIKYTYKYFCTPRTKYGQLFHLIRVPLETHEGIPEVEANVVQAELTLTQILNKDDRFKKIENELDEAENNGKNVFTDRKSKMYNGKQAIVSPKLAQAISLRLKPEFFYYEFDEKEFSCNYKPRVICAICHNFGHSKDNCRRIDSPPLVILPPMTPEFSLDVTGTCLSLYNTSKSDSTLLGTYFRIVKELENYLKQFYADANLEIFGSTVNGFGFKKSDLDICLRFSNTQRIINSECHDYIHNLRGHLCKYDKVINVKAITDAKVPIIKFKYPELKLDCDISLYNTLALRNTKLLKAYSEIDDRVKVLGHLIKSLAKMSEICDASRGGLSSYAYIIMMLYFLQRCEPPVIPVLQELYTGETKPTVMVEGHDTYFYEDIDNLKNVWDGYGLNKKTVGELWLDFLKFYTEKFNYNEVVITIKQKGILTHVDKLLLKRSLEVKHEESNLVSEVPTNSKTWEDSWLKGFMKIEDPFDYDHNLACTLTTKMFFAISSTLEHARVRFGTPAPLPKTDAGKMQYFFNGNKFSSGPPPRDGKGNICKKFNHFTRDHSQPKASTSRQGQASFKPSKSIGLAEPASTQYPLPKNPCNNPNKDRNGKKEKRSGKTNRTLYFKRSQPKAATNSDNQ